MFIEETAMREIREARGISQQQLADRLGVSQKVISQYERGEIEIPDYMVRAVCRALGVRVRELYLGMAATALA